MATHQIAQPINSQAAVRSQLYALLAEALGGYGERIDDPAELGPAMKRAQAKMDEGVPVLLEVMTAEESVFAKY